jgi:hypothetical protein
VVHRTSTSASARSSAKGPAAGVRSPLGLVGATLLAGGLLLASCGWRRSAEDAADVDPDAALAEGALLLGASKAPVFFLTSEPNAPALGFGDQNAKLIVRDDPSENGRTPVRVLGRLHLEAYVPDGLLEQRAKQDLTLEGTAIVLRAGDRVGLLAPRSEAEERRVVTWVPIAKVLLGPFGGTLPADMLTSKKPERRSALPRGIAYRLPAFLPLPIYDAPRGDLMSLVPPQPEDLQVAVLELQQNWFLVRVGRGPYLQGYTNAPLTLLGNQAKLHALPKERPSPGAQVPWRIAQSQGPLMRVAAGTQLRFQGRIVATFRNTGWARALSALDQSDVEVLAAVDEAITVRGVAPRAALTPLDESSFKLPPATGAGGAAELGSAWVP